MLIASNTRRTPPLLQTNLAVLKNEDKTNNMVNSTRIQGHLRNKTEGVKVDDNRVKSDVALKNLEKKLLASLVADELPVIEPIRTASYLQTHKLIQKLSNEIEDVHNRHEKRFKHKHTNILQLEMETLILQPESIHRIQLFQSEILPIFTVECQLSSKLLKNVQHCENFNLMQFESEKFQSLTHCIRFGQVAQREINISLNDNDQSQSQYDVDNKMKQSVGRLNFTVWWREPDTCLNEMLGMGVFDLGDVHNMNFQFENFNHVKIIRHGVHLASIHFKISLRSSQLNSKKKGVILHEVLSRLSVKQCADNNIEDNNFKNIDSNEVAAAQTHACNEIPVPDNDANSGENNNLQTKYSHVSVETNKACLLKGFVYVNETRNMRMATKNKLFLVCRRFWQPQPAVTVMKEENRKNFNYQEQFSIIADEQFLQCVEKEYLKLELWARRSQEEADDSFNDAIVSLDHSELVGEIFLPLYRFFIAYRDEAITNYICKAKLPVISIDDWVPFKTQMNSGELKCLLAIGSEEQITNLKTSRSFLSTKCNVLKNELFLSYSDSSSRSTNDRNEKTKENVAEQRASSNVLKKTKSNSAIGEFSNNHIPEFKVVVKIERANGLPYHTPVKDKKHSKRCSGAFKKPPPTEPPSTYVTFQAENGIGKVYKSHEGDVYATHIIEKSTKPQWNRSFHLSFGSDYFTNKEFIIKIWKKTNQKAETCLIPTPLEDAIIGFVSIDLTTLSKAAAISGWFDIIDFNKRPNGRLKVRFKLMEDTSILMQPQTADSKDNIVNDIAVFESNFDLRHLKLTECIENKLSELQQISQRLHMRLKEVTGENPFVSSALTDLESWQPFKLDDDNFSNEFDRDINTVPVKSANIDAVSSEIQAVNSNSNRL